MREYLELGSTPYGEDCAQVGFNDYHERARKECRVYATQLQRLFPGGIFTIKSFPHDFGSYFEVCIVYHDDDKISEDYAFNVESNLPEYWDEEAKKELGVL